MAEEGKDGGSAGQNAFLFFGFLLLLVIVWIARGAATGAGLRGIFINPPAPVGPGGTYGPAVNEFPTTTQTAR